MSVAITIRDVPEDVRDELAARASRAGQSLQEYVRAILVERSSKPAASDWLAQVRGRVRTSGSTLSSESILAARESDRK
jgi:plasmid stability protein